MLRSIRDTNEINEDVARFQDSYTVKTLKLSKNTAYRL